MLCATSIINEYNEKVNIMKRNLLIIIALLISGMASAQNGGNVDMNAPKATSTNNEQLYTYRSQFSVSETISRIEQILKTMEIPVFAKFDYGKNAEEAGLELRPNQVIVFGSPKVGTALMQENPSISIELPLKISVWEDKDGSVWASFPQMKRMAANYGMESNPVIGKMQELLEKIVIKAASQY